MVDKAITFFVKNKRVLGNIVGSLMIPPAGTLAGNGATVFSYSDVWYVLAEGGWGVLITHRIDTGGNIFAAFFVYGDNGTSAWYYVSGRIWTGNTFTGGVFMTTAAPGGLAALVGFDSTKVRSTKVGTASFLFNGRDSATLTYVINGVSGAKNTARLGF